MTGFVLHHLNPIWSVATFHPLASSSLAYDSYQLEKLKAMPSYLFKYFIVKQPKQKPNHTLVCAQT